MTCLTTPRRTSGRTRGAAGGAHAQIRHQLHVVALVVPKANLTSSDGGDSDASLRGVRHTKRPDFKALSDALPHSYPATTERDGNDIIAEAKKAAKKAYLMTVAQGIHSDDDAAGITHDDYYDDYDAPIYSKPGDRDKP